MIISLINYLNFAEPPGFDWNSLSADLVSLILHDLMVLVVVILVAVFLKLVFDITCCACMEPMVEGVENKNYAQNEYGSNV